MKKALSTIAVIVMLSPMLYAQSESQITLNTHAWSSNFLTSEILDGARDAILNIFAKAIPPTR
ncbi:MAG: hypothetical protein ACSW8I_10100 [bacterium]